MKSENCPHDVVIAHGKNWRSYPPKDATPHTFFLSLSLESKMTALAASELYYQGKTEKVLFSTGKTAGQNFPSEAQAMRDYLIRIGRAIPEENTLLEELSFDTPGNAEESKEIIEEYGFQDVALLTVHDHLPRTAELYKNYGVPISNTYASEDTVEHLSTHQARFVRKYKSSIRRKLEQMKERILRTGLKLDYTGKLLRLLTKKVRHQ
jgi:uncharacterized SAM-binding protein YcdF (DUF218 family)